MAMAMAPEVKTSCDDEDMISSLPDEILYQILIRLDIKMAFRAGILLRRWKHLPALLNHIHLTLEAKNSSSKRNARLLAFLNSFLAVANPQNSPFMTSLTVEFDYFTRGNERLLHQCIEVALSGGLKHLMLWNKSARYEFPLSGLCGEHGIGLRSLAISNCYTSQPHLFGTFQSLQNLVLCGFYLFKEEEENYKLGEERFQSMLASCSSLEVLSIEHMLIYPRLKINSPNQLKEVRIYNCDTKGIEIMHAHKLEKLEIMRRDSYYERGCCKFSMATLPCLKHVQLGFGCDCYYNEWSGYNLEKLSRAAPSLETLILSVNSEVCLNQKPSDVPFYKLRHLICEAQTSEAAKICSPFRISVLLGSAPFLESLEIDIREQYEYTHMPLPSDFSHVNLKELKVKGFHEDSMEIEMDLILFILERATSLERIIISRYGCRSKEWLMQEKEEILDRLPIGESSCPLITFT